MANINITLADTFKNDHLNSDECNFNNPVEAELSSRNRAFSVSKNKNKNTVIFYNRTFIEEVKTKLMQELMVKKTIIKNREVSYYIYKIDEKKTKKQCQQLKTDLTLGLSNQRAITILKERADASEHYQAYLALQVTIKGKLTFNSNNGDANFYIFHLEDTSALNKVEWHTYSYKENPKKDGNPKEWIMFGGRVTEAQVKQKIKEYKPKA